MEEGFEDPGCVEGDKTVLSRDGWIMGSMWSMWSMLPYAKNFLF